MSRRPGVLAFVVGAALGCVAATTPARAQTGPPPPLRIFMDCFQCDTEHLRQTVVFVDYMRDRTDADLHVLVTTQSTGGGGTSWTVRFIGLGRFEDEDRVVTFTTPQTATADDRRREFARQFKLGVAGYAADTTVAPDLDVTYEPPAAGAATAETPDEDPWDFWAFRVNGNLQLNGESTRESGSQRLSFSGSRVTPAWKTTFSLGGNGSQSTFTLSDGRQVRSRSDSWNAGALVVKSVGPRLSVGGRLNASHSSFSNTDQAISVYPGVEFNVFPYSEFENRSLTVWWEAGPGFYDYRETTIFDRNRETIVKHLMDVSLRLRQPWGSAGVFSSFSQDLAHLDRYRASVFGDADVRLFKGFSFNVFANYSRIRDQVSLPRAEASAEDVLLRLRQLSTDYSYSISFGLSYNFGSIFNSVVNPRFTNPNIFQ